MKKRLARILALAIALLMIIPFGAAEVFAEDEIEGINIYFYNVVYPAAASAETKNAVKAFADYLNEYCKVDVEVVSDTTKPINKEIVIGNTNRPAATDVILSEKDWYVCTDGTKIYINAYSEGALPMAMEWFKHNCLIDGSREAYVGDGYFYSHEYDFDGFTIDGESAEDLVIAYDNKDHVGFVDVAYSLTYSFMERNGLPLEVSAVVEREQPQLIIASALNGSKYLPDGVSVGASEYVLCKNGKDIVLVADSSYGAELAAQRIIDKIYAGEVAELSDLCSNTPVGYTIGKDSLSLSQGAEYRFMTFNPGRYTLIQDDRCDETLALMAYYQPDVIGFQEYCDYFSRHMTSRLDDIGYTMIGDELCRDLPENADNWLLKYNMTPIAYKTDRFECVASGWQRMDNTYDPANGKTYYGHQITWAILKDKQTGEIFGVTSTHFFHLSDRNKANPVRVENATELLGLVESLRAQYGCAFISVGDYNSYPTDEAYKRLEGSDTFRDSRDVATVERAITAAGHTYKNISTSANECIDFLFVTDEVSVVRNKIAINEITAAAGDHFPVYADIVINSQGAQSVSAEDTADISGLPGDTAPLSVQFAGISASEYKSNAANGKTTVGRNDYAPKVEIKTSAPLEEDEFWEMKNPPVEEPPKTDVETNTDSNVGQSDSTAKQESGGCGSSIGNIVWVLPAMAIACVRNKKHKEERE